jgi:D-glycero-D-manno-heptose 1,7-bisphosphate phosphatase
MRRAFFFDRDGIINEDTSYVYKISDFTFKPGIFDLMRYIQDLNFTLFIITNQSGINRKMFSKSDYNNLTNFMLSEFKKHDIKIENIYMCPHTPDDNCSCRKPKPTFILDAKKLYNLNLQKSWLIGDKTSDIQCGKNAGLSNLIFLNGRYPKPKEPCHIIQSLSEAKTLLTS